MKKLKKSRNSRLNSSYTNKQTVKEIFVVDKVPNPAIANPVRRKRGNTNMLPDIVMNVEESPDYSYWDTLEEDYSRLHFTTAWHQLPSQGMFLLKIIVKNNTIFSS